MMQMSVNWGDAFMLAGKSFGTVFLVLVILAVVTWMIGLLFQRVKRQKAEANSAAEVDNTKEKGD